MISLTPHMKVWVCCVPVDFRRQIDGIAAVCNDLLGKDPCTGQVFLFRNKRGASLKLLYYDGQGYWLCQKRLSQGRFKYWPKEGTCKPLSASQANVLLFNGDPYSTKMQKDWRPIAI